MKVQKKLKYHYYDTPDGHDYFKKMNLLVKHSVDFGLFMGLSDVFAITKPVGWLPLIDRTVRVSSRPIITAFLFSTSVYMATKIRNKDDEWNHVLGGLICGYYWHRYIAYVPITATLTTLVCAALYLGKNRKMIGTQLFYDQYAIREEVNYGAVSRFNTWTMSEKYPRTWLTPEEAAAKGIQS